MEYKYIIFINLYDFPARQLIKITTSCIIDFKEFLFFPFMNVKSRVDLAVSLRHLCVLFLMTVLDMEFS